MTTVFQGKCTDTILLVPFGNFTVGVAEHFLPFLLEYCQAFFPGMSVECLEKPLSLAKVGMLELQGTHWMEDSLTWISSCQCEVQKRQNDFGHDQYLIGDLFEALNKHTLSHRKAYCRLGITIES